MNYSNYDSNGALAVLYGQGDDTVIYSVNLVDEHIDKDETFLDINNIPDVEDRLKKLGIISGDPIRWAQSGFVNYPLYKIG